MNTRTKLNQLAAAVILLGTPIFAQPSAREVQGVSFEQAESILQELKQIRRLLSGGTPVAPPPAQQRPPETVEKAKVRVDPDRILGKKDAPMTIVEFTDVQCGFCRQFHATTFVEIRQKLIDTGKVRFVSRDLPLDVASVSLRAAEAMRCAGDQGRFWELREAILSSPGRLTNEKIDENAKAVGVDVPAMQTCIASRKHLDGIQKDLDEAGTLKVGGTPTFIIGRSTADGVDGVTLVGALNFAAFESKIREVEKQ
jgi:protein-disulfide isomerase